MATAFERCFQPNPHDFHRHVFRDYALTERKDIGVIMLTRKPGHLFVPTKRATHAVNFVRRHRFSISRSAKHNSALAFAARDRFRRWPDKNGIINRVLAKRSAVFHFMSK